MIFTTVLLFLATARANGSSMRRLLKADTTVWPPADTSGRPAETSAQTQYVLLEGQGDSNKRVAEFCPNGTLYSAHVCGVDANEVYFPTSNNWKNNMVLSYGVGICRRSSSNTPGCDCGKVRVKCIPDHLYGIAYDIAWKPLVTVSFQQKTRYDNRNSGWSSQKEIDIDGFNKTKEYVSQNNTFLKFQIVEKDGSPFMSGGRPVEAVTAQFPSTSLYAQLRGIDRGYYLGRSLSINDYIQLFSSGMTNLKFTSRSNEHYFPSDTVSLYQGNSSRYSSKYVPVTSGSSCNRITTISECNSAALALNLADKTAEDDGQNGVNYDPPFCYYEDRRLKFNSNGRNSGPCTTLDACICTGTFEDLGSFWSLFHFDASCTDDIIGNECRNLGGIGKTSNFPGYGEDRMIVVSGGIAVQRPSSAPTTSPSSAPTPVPSSAPSTPPSTAPTTSPSTAPTTSPSTAPSVSPSANPTTHTTRPLDLLTSLNVADINEAAFLQDCNAKLTAQKVRCQRIDSVHGGFAKIVILGEPADNEVVKTQMKSGLLTFDGVEIIPLYMHFVYGQWGQCQACEERRTRVCIGFGCGSEPLAFENRDCCTTQEPKSKPKSNSSSPLTNVTESSDNGTPVPKTCDGEDCTLECGAGKKLHEVAMHVKSTWAKVHQNWAIGTGECSNFHGYTKKGKHMKKCCLAPGKYELTCLTHSRFGWEDGYLEIDGKKECEKLKKGDFITKEVSLCEGSSCNPAPPAKLPECNNGEGVNININMFVEVRIESTAKEIGWELSDECKQTGYPRNEGSWDPPKHSKSCCLPKGKYKISCSSGFFSWDKSWLEINGRKYKECFDVQGETTTSRTLDFCNGKEDCPVFGKVETPAETTEKPTFSIGGNGETNGGGIIVGENGIEIDGIEMNAAGAPFYIIGFLITFFLI